MSTHAPQNIAICDTATLRRVHEQALMHGFRHCLSPPSANSLDERGQHVIASWQRSGKTVTVDLLVKVEGTVDPIYETVDMFESDLQHFQVIVWPFTEADDG